MTFKTFKHHKEKIFNNKSNGMLKIPRGTDIEKQVLMINLTKEDLQMINSLQPYIMDQIGYIVDRFYENLGNEPSLLTIINNNSSINRLKKTLKQHITEMFDGVIDRTYYDKRIRIAQIHVKIGLKSKWYMSAFQDILLSIINIIEEHVEDKEEVFLSIKAVSKILSLEQQIVLEAYDNETEQIRNNDEEQKILLRDHVTSASENLAAISEEANATFHQLTTLSDQFVSLTNKGTQLSVLAEEQAEEGKEQLTKQNVNIKNINQTVHLISNDVGVLLEISNRMQEIIDIVKNIADQTNLLSLNAAIEAARAGEAGKGFAVVANEVRKLSELTKQSVTNVSTLIQETNAQAEKLTQSLEKIGSAVEVGNDGMGETEAYFEQIQKTMNKTKLQNNLTENELVSIVNLVKELEKTFEEVAVSADNLSVLAHEMN